MLLPDDHGVTSHGPVVVQDDEDAGILEQYIAGGTRVVAEEAGHGEVD
jgi:hypothetical protein